MKKIALGLLVTCTGLTGLGYAAEIQDTYSKSIPSVVDPFQKHCSESSCPRGHRGHRGPRGHRGHKGKQGIPGQSVSTVSDRAYLLAPDNEFMIDTSNAPVIVPLDQDDLSRPFFDGATLHGFTVPESGVYQINYFLKAVQFDISEDPSGSDSSGMVVAIVLDENLLSPIGSRALPLVSPSSPFQNTVWGTHEIFIKLTQGQTVQLVVFKDPSIPGEQSSSLAIMEFSQTGNMIDEVAYLSIQKVGS